MNRYGNNSSRCFVDNFFTVISTSDNLTAEIFCQYFYVRKSNIIGNGLFIEFCNLFSIVLILLLYYKMVSYIILQVNVNGEGQKR